MHRHYPQIKTLNSEYQDYLKANDMHLCVCVWKYFWQFDPTESVLEQCTGVTARVGLS